ncbi:efflux transporter outer membrane subunit [Novosphingobium mangrovi (ex Huang et al. 2023)]|uniref:Efflux transporter outer membrane subunit n=1 Tax=Novosphingobium mangrovi (ex Huang et al. 2023) TaxID=2976432 RepID=A0ABT2I443_9SPHN|nr:efflux transporter outer membrane subunit [Novosphingobium mangrovi (ex Huang et al. 2023)]MCT2399565.1 efflux transporter outer membrane subunit [Novosphingobium mangrovi (ex Huang et al. 2023)]
MTSVRTIATIAFGFALVPLTGCTVGPDFVAPQPAAPDDWTSWRSADPSLVSEAATDGAMPQDWWTLFGDPVLDRLEKDALAASPDIETAALHYAQARVQLEGAGAAGLPQVNVSAGVARNRLSEYGASTRLFDAIGSDRDALAKFLAQPYTLYRGGFDAGWELDLWGKVRRTIEQAGAGATQQQALLDLTRLSVASEVARAYFDLRTTQHQIAISQDDIALLQDRVRLVTARVDGGLDNHVDLERESATLNAMRGALPALKAGEALQINRIAVLLGKHPGELNDELRAGGATVHSGLPDLSLGMPSRVALGRPDVRASLAQLHAATAGIGIATADLYPSIRLGGGFNLESYQRDNLFDWASRSWSIGPSLDLPLFDGGRRRTVVKLRKLQAREAAVGYQQTVLKAWQEIDDALSGYTSERQQNQRLTARVQNTASALELVEARYKAGALNYLPVIDAKRAHLQAMRDLADNEGRLRMRFVALNKAIGNAPQDEEAR